MFHCLPHIEINMKGNFQNFFYSEGGFCHVLIYFFKMTRLNVLRKIMSGAKKRLQSEIPLLDETHPAVQGVHAHSQVNGFQMNVAVLIEFRLPAGAAAKERGGAVFLFQDQVFLQRRQVFVCHKFFEAILPSGGLDRTSMIRTWLFAVIDGPIIIGAGYQDVRIIKNGLALNLHA